VVGEAVGLVVLEAAEKALPSFHVGSPCLAKFKDSRIVEN
jgi:hypothetical protein